MAQDLTASRRPLSAMGLIAVLVALGLGLAAADRLGAALIGYVYRASLSSPADRIAKAEPELLIMGSSLAKYSIDPARFLPRSYNAAANGQGLFYAAAVLRNLHPGGRVRRAVIGIEPGEFIAGYRDSNFKHLAMLAPLALEDSWLRRQLEAGDRWAAVENISRLYFYRGTLHLIVNSWLRPDPSQSGFEPLHGTKWEKKANGKGKDKDKDKVVNSAPAEPAAPETLEAFDRLLAAARENGIQVVAVVIPEWDRAMEREPQFAAIMREIRTRLNDLHMCDLTEAESEELARIRSDTRLFYDGAHMNEAGAARYSAELARLVTARCG